MRKRLTKRPPHQLRPWLTFNVMNSKLIVFLFLAVIPTCFGKLFPYAVDLEKADAVAVVTVTSCVQLYKDGLIHESATLNVDTEIDGIKVGEEIKTSFGLPSKPNVYRARLDAPAYKIAERYIVLIKRNKDLWVVYRASQIWNGAIVDGYFDDFSRLDGTPLEKGVELIKQSRKNIKHNQLPEPMR